MFKIPFFPKPYIGTNLIKKLPKSDLISKIPKILTKLVKIVVIINFFQINLFNTKT